MKTRLTIPTVCYCSLASVCCLTGFAQGTAFTYQGRLNNSANPANGVYDFRFALFQYDSGGNAVLGPITNTAVTVSNGLFTTLLDFGPYDPDAYGRGRWLEISVRTNGSGPLTTLSPRQQMTSAPSAIYAAYANNPSPGSGFNADRLDGLDSTDFWNLGGNTGTTTGTHFLGTADNQPLEFKVNGQRALRLEPMANGEPPNLIGGSSNNVVAAGVNGATIAGGVGNVMASNALRSVISGGEGNNIQGGYTTIGGGVFNRCYDNMFSTIGGGADNNVSASGATVGGGRHNGANAENACIAGGYMNYIAGGATASAVGGGGYNWLYDGSQHSVVSGGYSNTIAAYSQYSSIVGGEMNTIGPNAWNATILGGQLNNVTAGWSMAAGSKAKANHYSCFVWNSSGDDFATTGNFQFLISAFGGVGINKNNPATALDVNGTVKANAFSSSGNVTIAAPGSLSFGSQIRQMLNLWGTQYGIGVQNYGLYSRADTGGGFYWYAGGTHNDNPGNSGGGTTMMSLTGSGLTVNGTFVSASDRSVKENFKPVDSRAVLEKVAALPLSEWNYQADTASRHIGPMAQDFHAAFNVGPDDKHIATVDADGVALAAIQGLNQKLEQKLEQKETEITELKQRLEKLERLMNRQLVRSEQ